MAVDRVTVIAMIEDAEAIKHTREIAATPGIDALFVGPTDLSASLGVTGQRENPVLLGAITQIVNEARPFGTTLATTAQTAPESVNLYAQGFSMICHSTTSLMARSLKALRQETRQ